MTPVHLCHCLWSWVHFNVPELGRAFHSTYYVQRTQSLFQSVDISQLKMELQHGGSRRQRCFWFGVRGSLLNVNMDAWVPETSEMVTSMGEEYFLASWSFFAFLFWFSNMSLTQKEHWMLELWCWPLVLYIIYTVFALIIVIRVERSFQFNSWGRSRVFGDIDSIAGKWRNFNPVVSDMTWFHYWPLCVTLGLSHTSSGPKFPHL